MDIMINEIEQKSLKVFGVLSLITLPMQYYYDLPACISACWMGNTLITLTYSVITRKNPEFFKIPDTREEMNKLKAEMRNLQNDKLESLKRQKEMLDNSKNIEDFYEKMKKL